MSNWLSRTELLIGAENIEKLNQSNVLVVGLGGVGSFAAEFLCRAGIGKMTIVDGDVVDPTNKNRQLPALDSTAGLPKADIMAARMLDINPELQLTTIKEFLTPDRMEEIVSTDFDWVIDCIDSMQPKQYFIVTAVNKGVKIVSSMGAGGRLDPSKIKVADISKTKNCPFAQQIRKGLRKKGVKKGVLAVYSEELVDKKHMQLTENSPFKKSYYGTISYIPAAFGLTIASVLIRAIVDGESKK
jgi:tRNA A37 threonylcarbamoyladenosine dehydratase